MIVSRTPVRISCFGGASDYPAHYLRHGGKVLGFAIDKYCYLTIRRLPPFFEHRHRLVYSHVETVKDFSELQHPAARAVLMQSGITDGLEIHHDGDLPARSGIGSSSAFTVGLLHALEAYQGKRSTAENLARQAIRIEQDVIGENVGSQDQVWAAYGGLNRIDFAADGITVRPLRLPALRQYVLLAHLMLFFTGFARNASEVAGEQIKRMEANSEMIQRLAGMVDEAERLLLSDEPLVGIGHLLHDAWQVKRELAASVSSAAINAMYDSARHAGAIGGKLLGAGGGGFMLLFVPIDRRPAVREALRGLIEVNFNIDHRGSQIVLYEPDGWSGV